VSLHYQSQQPMKSIPHLKMDPTPLEAIKAHMESILQTSMQDALTSLRQEFMDQMEAHHNELVT